MNTNTEHTKGPWVWRGHICTGIEGPESQVVADVGLACGAISKQEAQANARLIAAAPDLLTAAKYLISGEGWATGRNLDALRAAIAKAEGR